MHMKVRAEVCVKNIELTAKSFCTIVFGAWYLHADSEFSTGVTKFLIVVVENLMHENNFLRLDYVVHMIVLKYKDAKRHKKQIIMLTKNILKVINYSSVKL